MPPRMGRGWGWRMEGMEGGAQKMTAAILPQIVVAGTSGISVSSIDGMACRVSLSISL